MWLLASRNAFRGGAGVVAVVCFVAIQFVPFTQVTMLVLMLALAAYGIVWSNSEWRSRRARLEAEEFTRHNDWTFEHQLNGLFAMLTTAPFDVDQSTYTNVVTGRFGGYECFDGVYTWRRRIDQDKYISGKHRVAAVRLSDELPRLVLLPEGMSARVAKAFGAKDIDFESSTFNRAWRVIADDPKVAHEMLNPRAIARLEAMGSKAPLIFEKGLGVRVDNYSNGIDSLADRLRGIVAVAHFLPKHTIEDHGRLANSIGPLPSVAIPGAMTRGYEFSLHQEDAQHVSSAKLRKHQKWIDAARHGQTPPSPPSPPQSGS